jgi:predicted nucleic acid-binding protein
MIFLDTNVVSEAMKPEPSPAITQWLNEQSADTLFLTTVTMTELNFGIAAFSDGKRKTSLTLAVEALVNLFNYRILAFDLSAANEYAKLAIKARQKGKGFPTPDGYIAAIAASKGFMIASRDTAPFLAAELKAINHWQR